MSTPNNDNKSNNQPVPPAMPQPLDEKAIRRTTRRAFGVAALASILGVGGFKWLQSRSDSQGIPWPLRQVHRFNEVVGRGLYSPTHLAPEFPIEQAKEPRANGWNGWQEGMNADTWTVQVERPGEPVRPLTIPQIFGDLPRVEMTTEFKCIEGWSEIVHWSGVRFIDFVRKQGWEPKAYPYVYMTTANEVYYVGLDIASALHPQTLLVDRMNGESLTDSHGGPLRLVITVKYGIKNIKWLSRIRFQNELPEDYWANRGYDWYAGL